MTDNPETPPAVPARLNATVILGAFLTGAAAAWGAAGTWIIGKWCM